MSVRGWLVVAFASVQDARIHVTQLEQGGDSHVRLRHVQMVGSDAAKWAYVVSERGIYPAAAFDDEDRARAFARSAEARGVDRVPIYGTGRIPRRVAVWSVRAEVRGAGDKFRQVGNPISLERECWDYDPEAGKEPLANAESGFTRKGGTVHVRHRDRDQAESALTEFIASLSPTAAVPHRPRKIAG